MTNLITKEMKINTAKNIYEEISSLKRSLLSGYSDSLFTAEEVIEKIGYTIQCCVREIMRYLDVEDDDAGENFGIISDCIMDDDTFEYMMDKLISFGSK